MAIGLKGSREHLALNTDSQTTVRTVSSAERRGQAPYARSSPSGLRIAKELNMATKPAKKGLYANIAAKKTRIAQGSGEKMREPGSPGAPEKGAFEKAAKTPKKKA